MVVSSERTIQLLLESQGICIYLLEFKQLSAWQSHLSYQKVSGRCSAFSHWDWTIPPIQVGTNLETLLIHQGYLGNLKLPELSEAPGAWKSLHSRPAILHRAFQKLLEPIWAQKRRHMLQVPLLYRFRGMIWGSAIYSQATAWYPPRASTPNGSKWLFKPLGRPWQASKIKIIYHLPASTWNKSKDGACYAMFTVVSPCFLPLKPFSGAQLRFVAAFLEDRQGTRHHSQANSRPRSNSHLWLPAKAPFVELGMGIEAGDGPWRKTTRDYFAKKSGLVWVMETGAPTQQTREWMSVGIWILPFKGLKRLYVYNILQFFMYAMGSNTQ